MRILSPAPLVLLLVLLSVLSAGGASSTIGAQCGKRNGLPFAFVYGSDAFRGQFPWHVAIYNSVANRESADICGGTIVTRSFVVTAAHCLDNWQKPQLYYFIAGLHDHQNVTGTSSYNVSEIILHPEFNRTTFINDVALLRSDGDIEYTYLKVLPVCLPRGDAGTEFTVEQLLGQRGFVAGWDSPHIIRKSNILQTTTVIGIGYLRGIVSLTPRQELPNGIIGCDPDGILGFTDVARYTKWIDGHLNQ